jgi:hypothetical protein
VVVAVVEVIDVDKLVDLVVVEVDQVKVVEQEIHPLQVQLKVPLVELHQEHLIQLELVVVEQHKQDNQVVDQEILQGQEVQEHQTILITHAQLTLVVEVVVDLKTTLDQEVLVRVELVVVDKEVIQVALQQLEELTLVVEVELVEVLALILKQVKLVDQVLLL